MIRTTALLLIAMSALAACSKPAPAPPPPKPLIVAKVSAGETAIGARTYSGELRPRVDTTLGFQVGGKIVERRANVGDHVKAGQVLARLDAMDTRLTADQADAQLNIARADAERYRELRRKQFVSQASLDDRENKLKAAQAHASLARNQSAHTTLVADKAGVIGLVMADIGQVVTPGQGVMRMATDGDREIVVFVPEAEFGRFRVGMKAEVSLFATPGEIYQGQVREISPVADASTHTYPLRIQLNGVERLPTGLTATVRFPALTKAGNEAGNETGIAVPLAAIFQKGDQPAVWVVNAQNAVSLRPVQILRYTNTHAILSGGVTPGETIAAAGVNSLLEGQIVRPISLAKEQTKPTPEKSS
jgi:membrane fusion protein, multidrug efflux system